MYYGNNQKDRSRTANMGNNDLLTDEYVAEVLVKEAQDCSLKYSAMGLEAFKTQKKFVDAKGPLATPYLACFANWLQYSQA